MSNHFIFHKTVDKSLLTQGFVIPVKHHKTVAQCLSGGALSHGEKRRIKIFFGGALHDVELASVDFDRAKYPNHSDIWRVLYGADSTIADNFSRAFPPSSAAGFDFFATDIRDVFYAEPIINNQRSINQCTISKILSSIASFIFFRSTIKFIAGCSKSARPQSKPTSRPTDQ